MSIRELLAAWSKKRTRGLQRSLTNFGVGEGVGEFLSTVCTCKTEEVYLHGGNDGLVSGIFT